MFTGLVEEIGKVATMQQTKQGMTLGVKSFFSKELKLGDSVSVNGICSTVVDIKDDVFFVEYSTETLKLTNISTWKINDNLNLERPLTLSQRLDGHLVSGHIDGTAVVKSITNEGFSKKITFNTSKELAKYIIKKGSIAINGCSLTITEAGEDNFSVCIIPHTQNKTNITEVNINGIVNIEVDMVAKYIEKFCCLKDNVDKSNITVDFLTQNGFV